MAQESKGLSKKEMNRLAKKAEKDAKKGKGAGAVEKNNYEGSTNTHQ